MPLSITVSFITLLMQLNHASPQGYNRAVSGSSETVCTDIENNFLWSNFVQEFVMLKLQKLHYTAKNKI